MLVGAGHAHIEVLRRFGQDRPLADLHVLTDHCRIFYSGMVPGLIEGRYHAAELTIDVESIVRRAGATLHLGRMVGLDERARVVETVEGKALDYDLVSFNLGAISGRPESAMEGWSTEARPIRTLVDALMAGKVLCTPKAPLVVVGGGAAGVELAAAFASRVPAPTVTLIECAERLLPDAPPGVAGAAHRRLTSSGVRVRLGRRVTDLDSGRVELEDGMEIRGRHVLWATPARGGTWFSGSGLELDASGFLKVTPTFRALNDPNCFAVGDCASFVGLEGIPRSGAVAVHQGPLLAHNLRRAIENRPLRAFRPRAGYLTLLNLGRGHAAGYRGNLQFSGRWVMRLKDGIDRRWVDRYR